MIKSYIKWDFKSEDKPDYCTGEDCILIDDYELNIKEWENCGGTGLLFTDASTNSRAAKKDVTNLPWEKLSHDYITTG